MFSLTLELQTMEEAWTKHVHIHSDGLELGQCRCNTINHGSTATVDRPSEFRLGRH